MPRKRKSLVLSPLRKPSSSDSGSWPALPSSSVAQPLSQTMSNNRNEALLRRMCEMFPDLDPTLVEMVLSESKEAEVVDHLLELSNAAKMEIQSEPVDKYGFDMIASYLDDDQANFNPEILEVSDAPDTTEDAHADFGMDMPLSNDLDSLLDEALIQFSNSENAHDPEEFDNVDFQELLQTTSSEEISFPMGHAESASNTTGDIDIAYQASVYLNDGISYDKTETDFIKSSEISDLDRDFNLKLNMFSESEMCGPHPSAGAPEISEKPEASNEDVKQFDGSPALTSTSISFSSSLSSVPPKPQQQWNPLAPSFYPLLNTSQRLVAPIVTSPLTWAFATNPRVHNPGAFFTPSITSYAWNTSHFPQHHWHNVGVKRIGQPEVGPQAAVPLLGQKNVTHLAGKVLVLLRGAPGSGKSTLARMLMQKNPCGVTLSTDDYFSRDGLYRYDASCLGDAHEWNHKQAREAFENNVSPIIIDNTNLQGWEMKPYVSLAVRHKYKVIFREPDTWWKFNPKELERRNRHGVKREKIKRMLENYELVTVNSILGLPLAKVPEKSNIAETTTTATLFNPNLQRSTLSSMSKNKADATSTQRKDEHILDTDVSGISPSGSETIVDPKEDSTKWSGRTDFADEKLNELMPSGEGACSGQIQKDDDGIKQAFVDEDIANSDSRSGEPPLTLNERPEFLSFVGDWPVEQQTMSQRAPRTRKKVRPSKMHKASSKLFGEGKNGENKSKQTDSDPLTLIPSEGQWAGIALTCDVEDSNNNSISKQCETEGEVTGNKTEQNSKQDVADLMSDMLQSVSESLEDMENVAPSTAETAEEGIASLANPEIEPQHPRHNCRHCKLALTFSGLCSDSQNTGESRPICQSQDTSTEVVAGPSKSSQTEPHEFALLWRIDRKNINAMESAKVLIGKSDRFKSKMLDASLGFQENIPYRVMHHKSTFVEEDEISSLGAEESLTILCKLFRSLSFDVLRDLYERCNKDIQWATNLLLDSGEKLHIDEDCSLVAPGDCEVAEPDCAGGFCQLVQGSTGSDDNDNEHHENLTLSDQSSESSSTGSADLSDLLDDSDIDTECSNVMNSVLQIVSGEVIHPSDSSVSDLTNTTNTLPDGKRKNSLEQTADDRSAHFNAIFDVEREKSNVQESSNGKEATLFSLNSNDYHSETDQMPNFTETGMVRKEPYDNCDNPSAENPEATGQCGNTSESIGEDDAKQGSGVSLPKESLMFDHLELSLPPELAHQLSELFGPVGIDPGSLTIEDCLVRIDMDLARAIHKRWKESITERHRQEALSYQLIFEDSSVYDPLEPDKANFAEQLPWNSNTQEPSDLFPFMDQWNARTTKVSLRQIMSEETALQEQEELRRSSPRKNCASKLKEKQLFEMFPTIEQKLLMDIFAENKYSLQKSEQFMRSVLEADPVHNVVAPYFKQITTCLAEKHREKPCDMFSSPFLWISLFASRVGWIAMCFIFSVWFQFIGKKEGEKAGRRSYI
uniref:NEDD4 binding protein 2 n=1 Tax=Leptobrachium leishanense TaxID=445787 RepID=A0A8C5PZJ9_9ANUR